MASKKRRKKWFETFADFVDGVTVTCPNCGSHKLKDNYIELNKIEHIGWGAFWCEDCKEGLVLSRVNLIDETLRKKIIPILPDDLKFI